MSLFERYQVEPVEEAVPTQSDYAVVIRQTKTGRDIMVCTAEIAPQAVIDEAAAMGLPLFVAPEIARMRHCHQDQVDHILATKRAFPGCTVQQILNEERDA
ncbi:MAG: hypothetical protein FDZ69_07555 [Deltaproteobacteria bacterium]|nr:MAG: hypothetical protein FDZ69_07555 [Deltaproteobacteria bacterium]